MEGSETLRLASISAATPEGRTLLASAKRTAVRQGTGMNGAQLRGTAILIVILILILISWWRMDYD